MTLHPAASPSASVPARVELSIGELELIGFSVAQRHAIADALQRSLAELVTRRAWPHSQSAADEAHAAITLDPHAAPEQVGRAIAEAIFHAAGTARTDP